MWLCALMVTEGLLHNKPVQGLRLINDITGFMPNQPKIDQSLYWLGDGSPISMATSDYLLVMSSNESETGLLHFRRLTDK